MAWEDDQFFSGQTQIFCIVLNYSNNVLGKAVCLFTIVI